MKIAVLTSGGVDSSVALKLLKEQGHDLTAFYLKIWLEDDLKFLGAECPWEEDLRFVRKICADNDIPLKIIPLQKEYFDTVVSYTIEEVKAGRTPNPDIMCNNQIKFKLFLEKAGKDFDKVATGHYAKMAYAKEGAVIDLNLDIDSSSKKSIGGRLPRGGKYILKAAPDPIKDQTYFLSNLKQEQLEKLIFPIGDLTKEEVRELAEKYDLPNKDRKDSQGICFLGKLKYDEFIKHYLGEKKGDFIEHETGEKLGEHEGFWYFTIGQRRGIKLPDGPWFVVGKEKEKNIVYISKKYYESDKKRDEFEVENLNWFDEKLSPVTTLTKDVPGDVRSHKQPVENTNSVVPEKDSPGTASSHKQPAGTSVRLQVKLRHGPKIYGCLVSPLPGTTPHPVRLKVKLSENDQGIAPGQFAAFYLDDICLGSGVIC